MPSVVVLSHSCQKIAVCSKIRSGLVTCSRLDHPVFLTPPLTKDRWHSEPTYSYTQAFRANVRAHDECAQWQPAARPEARPSAGHYQLISLRQNSTEKSKQEVIMTLTLPYRVLGDWPSICSPNIRCPC